MELITLQQDRSTGTDVKLAVEVEGQGKPLLLIHGFPVDHIMWQGQLTDLADMFRLIAPDLPGFGESPPTLGTATMEQMADHLAQLLDALGIQERVIVCGLSMGGYIAFEFLRRHKERLAGLILCDTRAQADSKEARQNRHQTADRVLQEGTEFLAQQMLPRLCCEQTFRQHPEIIEALQKMIAKASREGVAAASRGMAARSDATELLAKIDLPTLVLVGQFDVISPPEEMEKMAQAIPGARFVIIPEAGHMAPLENAPAVNEAIRQWYQEKVA